jgi:apolipoprotein N-acyltransferase
LQLHHVALITGAYGVGVQKAERMLTNSLFLLNDAGEVDHTTLQQNARHPAFGEYIPFSEDVIPQIRAILPPIGRFARRTRRNHVISMARFENWSSNPL